MADRHPNAGTKSFRKFPAAFFAWRERRRAETLVNANFTSKAPAPGCRARYGCFSNAPENLRPLHLPQDTMCVELITVVNIDRKQRRWAQVNSPAGRKVDVPRREMFIKLLPDPVMVFAPCCGSPKSSFPFDVRLDPAPNVFETIAQPPDIRLAHDRSPNFEQTVWTTRVSALCSVRVSPRFRQPKGRPPLFRLFLLRQRGRSG